MTTATERENAAARSIFLFSAGAVFCLGWLSLGAPAFAAGVCVVVALWFSGAQIRGALIALVSLAGLSVVFHLAGGWDPAWLWESPRAVVPWAVKAIANDQGDDVFRWWLNAWTAQNAIPSWQLIHGGIYGAVIASGVRVAMLFSPVRRKLRAERKAIRQQKTGHRIRKPRFKNADRSRADVADGSVIGNTKQGGGVVCLTDRHANTHTLVAGTTGGGKTVTVLNLVESFINRGLPVLYIDGKGDAELGRKIVRYGKAQGRDTHLFSMVGESVSYNPLSSGSFTSRKDRLVELREWTEPHYRKLAEGYLQMVFHVLDAVGKQVNLCEVSQHMTRDHLTALVRETVKAGTISGKQGQSLFTEIQEQEKAEEHVEGIVAEIRNLARSDLRHLFEGPGGLEIGAALGRGEVIYMGLNPLQYPSLAALLGRLIVNDFKSTLDPSRPQKTLVVLDEFGVFAGDQVLNVINQGRSAGLCAVLTVQSVADIGRTIEQNADMFVEQVFSNCNNFLIHRINSAENAEQLAAIIGTRMEHEITAQLSDTGATGVGSVRSTREFIVHPDAIKSLGTGEAIFLNRNDNSMQDVLVRHGKIERLRPES